MSDVETLTVQIKAQVGGPEYRARLEAKRRLGLIPERKRTNGAISNYYYEPAQFEFTPEQIQTRKEFVDRVRGRA